MSGQPPESSSYGEMWAASTHAASKAAKPDASCPTCGGCGCANPRGYCDEGPRCATCNGSGRVSDSVSPPTPEPPPCAHCIHWPGHAHENLAMGKCCWCFEPFPPVVSPTRPARQQFPFKLAYMIGERNHRRQYEAMCDKIDAQAAALVESEAARNTAEQRADALLVAVEHLRHAEAFGSVAQERKAYNELSDALEAQRVAGRVVPTAPGRNERGMLEGVWPSRAGDGTIALDDTAAVVPTDREEE